MGDLLAVEPSLPVTPVTLLPVLFDQSVMSVNHSISLQTVKPLINQSIVYSDQYQYLGNCPPTPPLTQH